MKHDKTVPMNFRIGRKIKGLLELAADRDHRSMTNMLEVLILEYCKKHGITDEINADERNRT